MGEKYGRKYSDLYSCAICTTDSTVVQGWQGGLSSFQTNLKPNVSSPVTHQVKYCMPDKSMLKYTTVCNSCLLKIKIRHKGGWHAQPRLTSIFELNIFHQCHQLQSLMNLGLQHLHASHIIPCEPTVELVQYKKVFILGNMADLYGYRERVHMIFIL